MAEDPERRTADLRVVDYKTGNKDFSVVSICNRQDLQLIVYALAAVEMYRMGDLRFAKKAYQPQVGGVLYTKLRDDMDTVKPDASEQLSQKADGVVVMENFQACEALYKTDRTLAEDGVSESDFIRIKLKKDGMPDSYSKVMERKNFDVLMDYVKKAVVDMDHQIQDGVVEIAPAKDACSYCVYQDICLHDGKAKQGVSEENAAWDCGNLYRSGSRWDGM